jgi:hypothetical protein
MLRLELAVEVEWGLFYVTLYTSLRKERRISHLEHVFSIKKEATLLVSKL